MALNNYPVATAATTNPPEYLSMCIGSAITCPSLKRNFCVSFVFQSGYASFCTNGGMPMMVNAQSPASTPAGFVVPKGCCLSGTCCSILHGYFFGD